MAPVTAYCFAYFFTPMQTNSDVVQRSAMISVVYRGYRIKAFNCPLNVTLNCLKKCDATQTGRMRCTLRVIRFCDFQVPNRSGFDDL